jgi:hypothetical protein
MSIYKKLLEVKKEVGKISKDSTNPFFKSKYFDVNALLEHVEPILQKNGLVLLQPIKDGSVSTCIYDVDSSDSICSSIALPNIGDPQKLGSAITYFRRYTLQSLLGLQAEDDDGNKASKPVSTENTKDWFNVGSDAWLRAINKKVPLSTIKQHYNVSKANAKTYEDELKKVA